MTKSVVCLLRANVIITQYTATVHVHVDVQMVGTQPKIMYSQKTMPLRAKIE